MDAPTEALPAAGSASGRGGSLIGRTLGKFLVVERLGQGGAGEVFLAEERALGRTVVVKVLREEHAGQATRIERFLREAKLASRLDHPYAAHVYAFGVESDGLLWIAMEHVRGSTLDELLARRGPIPPAVFAPLFARLCEVVHTAHELGIVHRDIKTSNVMVIERAGQLLPKLLDFGIAKLGDDAPPSTMPVLAPGSPELTGEGAVLGTPNYMAPEQWDRPSEVDGRADIYALGVLAYRSLSGVMPFVRANRFELGAAHRDEVPRPLANVLPALGPYPALGDVVARALAKRPDERWQDGLTFAIAIRNAVGGTATEAVPIFDPVVRDAWLAAGPQPLADAASRLAAASTTVEMDAALRELVAIACRWLAILALASLEELQAEPIRAAARGVIGGDNATPWIRLARAIALQGTQLPGLAAALAGSEPLVGLAERLDRRTQPRTAATLASDVTAITEALRALEPLLAYELVVGRGGAAERWTGRRTRTRQRVVIWDAPLADGDAVLVDGLGKIVVRLSPFVRVIEPLPSMEPELFVLWRGERGAARLVAAPWGFEHDDAAAGERLAAIALDDTDTANDPSDESPYPGLAAYGARDAARFFGRDREIESMVNRLVRSAMVAVLGPSGVGKSSFVHAGLVPRLLSTLGPQGQDAIVTLRPGRHPLRALEAHGDLRALGESMPHGVLLVIDQLEELVTLCGDREEREQFATQLAALADGPQSPVRVVVTVRDDFATVLESTGFAGRFDVFVLATPPADALREIVIEPARRAGVAIETRVVDDIVEELAGRPAALPLLSFTAARLWETRDKTARRITHAAYVVLGGVAGALATYADEVYERLGRRDQEIVRSLFGRLVAADGTRIPAARSELDRLPGASSVIDHLIDARLLVVRESDETADTLDGEGPVDAVEIVHECLAERWPRLVRWRQEDAGDRALLGDVRTAARRWHEQQRAADLLWRGAPLVAFRELADRGAALTDVERALLDESERAERRSRTLKKWLVGGALVASLAVAGVMAYLGIAARDSERGARDSAEAARFSAGQARDAAALAEQRLTASYIAQGRQELAVGRARPALRHFAEALRRGADDLELRTMIAFASRGLAHAKILQPSGATNVAMAPDGTWFAAGHNNGTVRIWSHAGERLAEIPLAIDGKPLGIVDAISISRDGARIAVLGQTGMAVIDAVNRRPIAVVPLKQWAWSIHAGPNPDEVTLLEQEQLEVLGFDGVVRRRYATHFTGTVSPVYDATGTRLFVYDVERLSVVDLVTMQVAASSCRARRAACSTFRATRDPLR